MHDPDVVAFEIRRPWPQRSAATRVNPPRWRFHGAFWYLAGRCWFWPPMVTIWHREPRGHDSGTICRHFRRWQDDAGTWHSKVLRGWRWHVWHWRAQLIPLQNFRRWALTRCTWCGGRSRKRDQVNVSHSWDGPTGRWWKGEPGLFHSDCSSVHHAHRQCLCEDPLFDHDGYGTCQLCGKFRAFQHKPTKAETLLAGLPVGGRITSELRPEVERLWAEARSGQSS